MRIVETGRLPEMRRHKNLKPIFEHFISMNTKFTKVELDIDDYEKPIYGYKSLWIHAKKTGVPVKVIFRNGEVYFERRDI